MAKVKAPLMDVVDYFQGAWHSRRVAFEDILTPTPEEKRTGLIFASSKLFLDCEDFRLTLSNRYAIPPVFWTPLRWKSNGYFDSKDIYDANGRVKGHNTCYRFIVKKVYPMRSTYSWSEMSFFSTWTADFNISICFDVPKASQMRLFQGLILHQQPFDVTDVYASHGAILGEVLTMYDESIWALRDGVREIEKGRNENSRLKTDYPFLHDFARHVIHSTETLGVALDTVDQIIEQYQSVAANLKRQEGQKTKAPLQMDRNLHFQRQMLKNLRARSEANQLRLQNEINFAFNIAGQKQNETLLSINKGTKDDGAAMRAVAIVTLTFLPATFVSALFSMQFFDFSPSTDSQPEAWVISKNFWIYWCVTIPLTVITMACWYLWRHWQRRKSSKEE